MGHSGDRSDARVHLAALGQGEVFDDYSLLARYHLQKAEVWPFVVTIAELLKTTGLINGQDIFQRAMQRVPKISAQELELFKRAIDSKYGDQLDQNQS